MSIKKFIQLVEQAQIPNMQVLGQLPDGFTHIHYNGMTGVLDQQTNKMILLSNKINDSYHIVTVADGRETTQYVSGSELGPATKQAIASITPRQRPRSPAPVPVQESYESTEQVRSIVQRMMEDARVPQKPRQGPLRPQTGAGKHKDKKKDQKQGKAKHKGKELDEGRFGRNRDDQFSLGGRMPRIDRIDRDSSSGQDAQQRMERKLKQQTIDRLLDKGFKVDALNGKSLPELIQMLRESQPNIAIGGLSRRTDKAGNTTDRYQAGPMDITMTKNAQGQPVHTGGTYRVNKTASINVDVPYKGGQKGITTMVGKADDPEDLDHLMGAGASAERKGVDPKAFARFQQGVREAVKKPNATTRHLRDYPVSDKDVAKPVKKPEKKKPEQGVAEGSDEGKTQKYEMMLSNGKVKRFTAKDDADAKRIAKGHGAKSVIKMKGDLPGNKIAEQGVAEGSLEEIFNPTSAIAGFLRSAASIASDLLPVGIAAVGTFAATSALLGPVAAAIAGSTAGSQIFQTLQNQQNKVPGFIQQMIEKHFGSEAEAQEFALVHAKAAFLNQTEFRWRGQQWSVTLKKNQAEAIIEKNDKYWLDQQSNKEQDVKQSNKEQGVAEEKQKGVDGKACWKGYKRMGTKKKGGRTVDNCVKMESISEGILKSFGLMEKSPPGFKGTVKAMKKHPELTKGKTKDGKEKNPWALAWHMKNKGYKSHKKADGSDKD